MIPDYRINWHNISQFNDHLRILGSQKKNILIL